MVTGFPLPSRTRRNMMVKSNQPAARFRLGYVAAKVWKNDEFYNVVLARSYKEGNDWKETDQLNAGDLQNAREVLQKACDFVSEQA